MTTTGDTFKINSGNVDLDKKIEEWLQWDKVKDFFMCEIFNPLRDKLCLELGCATIE